MRKIFKYDTETYSVAFEESDALVIAERGKDVADVAQTALKGAQHICETTLRRVLPEDEEFNCGLRSENSKQQIEFGCANEICLGDRAVYDRPSHLAVVDIMKGVVALKRELPVDDLDN